MTSYAQVAAAAASCGLVALGGTHDPDATGMPQDVTLILLGPDPVRFWPLLQAAPEARLPDPVDAWSMRVITDLAHALGARPRFPFGTPPQPFIRWALASGTCHLSPVGPLVHESLGLNVSFRGALLFAKTIALPPAGPRPCETCAAPCLGACPVDAMTPDGYDLAACHSWLDEAANTCMTRGCAVRRACPVSPARPDAQAAHHMAHFHEVER
ncbi:ferredoxin [Jannaschia sp. 2305UL9-9]|uniref:ferredoxin n=1 Tax=Jannaschia sp. 2305UL9-9 TaxID=3121638 RepID=UPI0035280BE0